MTDVVSGPVRPITGETPAVPSYAVERAPLPLVWKLFGLTATVVILVVGIAVAITIDRANRVAVDTVNKSIAAAARLFRDLERQRLGRLTLPAQLLGSDSNFTAYIQTAIAPLSEPPVEGAPPGEPSAPASIDLLSIVDQIEQRRASFGSDLMILLDDEGRIVSRTDQPSVTLQARQDLYEESPLVKKIVDDQDIESTSGLLPFGGRMYHAAVVPIGAGANRVRVGFLVNAYAIDLGFANSIAGSTNAGVMFFSRGADLTRSANSPAVTMKQMHSVETIFKTGKRLLPITADIEGNKYILTGEPLMAGENVVGAAVFLRSLDAEIAPFRRIQNTLLAGGGGALLLAFILSWLIAKRMTRPIEELARMAQAVTAGDYSVQPGVSDRRDEVGILSRSFSKMISSLRDKAELEELYQQMASRSAEREAIGASHPPETPMRDEGTLLVTDLRGIPPAVGDKDAGRIIDSISRIMKVQETEVERQEGEVRQVIGTRIMSVFRGDRGVIHAIRAARAINEELATQSGTLHSEMSIGAGIVTGEFVSGSIETSRDSGRTLVGDAPLLALLFAWHAPAGHAFISFESAQTAGQDVMASSTRDEIRVNWLAQPLVVSSLPLVSVTTGMIRSMGGASVAATLKIDASGAMVAPLATAELPSGQLFANRYQIEQIIGRGGMGVVYKATDTQLDETVAIKTLPGDVMQRSSENLERFKREIRLARKITHRNVLRTYDYGEADGVYFISMEFVRGYTLSELLTEASGRHIAPRVALGISRQICRGLQAAHEQTIIHRDIKPQNVLIDSKGEVKLMDFGIARMAEAPEAMTQAGLIVGTPHYMSPEQVRGDQLDPRSDVYSMGVMIYEMLTGRRPFESSSLTGVLTAHITETPVPAIERRPEIGERVNAIVMRCLAKDPRQRYADAGALLTDLDSVQMASAA